MKAIAAVAILLALAGLPLCAYGQFPTDAPRYYFVLLTRPESAHLLSLQESEKLQEAHMANIRKLHAEHKLLVAGPFLDDASLRGIFVFQAHSAGQVREWTKTDPAVKAGRLVPTVYGPWRIDPDAIHPPAIPEGMEKYTLVLMRINRDWHPQPDGGAADLPTAHAAYQQKLKHEGKIALAGVLLQERGELGEVTIFRLDLSEASKLAEADPLVRAGEFRAEAHPWATGKGVLAPGLPMK